MGGNSDLLLCIFSIRDAPILFQILSLIFVKTATAVSSMAPGLDLTWVVRE